MPPFAGDIGAGPGSLKWIAQIPRKAYRWSLGRGSKCCGGASNVEADQRERLFLMPPPRQEKLERSLILGDPSKRTQTRSGSGVVFNFVDGRSRILLEGGWWVSRTHIPNQTWLLPTDAVQRWGYAKRHLQSILQLLSSRF